MVLDQGTWNDLCTPAITRCSSKTVPIQPEWGSGVRSMKLPTSTIRIFCQASVVNLKASEVKRKAWGQSGQSPGFATIYYVNISM